MAVPLNGTPRPPDRQAQTFAAMGMFCHRLMVLGAELMAGADQLRAIGSETGAKALESTVRDLNRAMEELAYEASIYNPKPPTAA